jgi:Fic family protein
MRTVEVTPFLEEREARARRLDRGFPSDRFSQRVRQTVYKYALIRNGWGTTNIDAGPIELARVDELYEAYRSGAVRPGRVLPSEVEVLNYFRLVDDLPTEPFRVGKDDLQRLHRAYFTGVPLHNDGKPGQWKVHDNIVGALRTTPKERVQRDLDDLLEWLAGPAQDLPSLVRAAHFFHEFQRIHPSDDGNGRLGRLATLTVLSSSGLPNIRLCPIDDAINEDREGYYRELALADRGQPEHWVGSFASTVVQGYTRGHLLAERLQRIPSDLEEDGQALLEWVYIHRIAEFRFRDARTFFAGLSDRTIQRRLGRLEESGLMTRTGHGEGTRYRVATLHEVTRGAEP